MKGKAKKEKEPNATQNRESISNNDNVDDSGKLSNTFSGFFKKNWNRDLLMEQIQKGWSFFDAGDLTIGDLYLMVMFIYFLIYLYLHMSSSFYI